MSEALEKSRGRPGRPPRRKNRRTLDLQACVRGLVQKGQLSPRQALLRLNEIALSEAQDRVPALKLLLAYLYGPPKQSLTVELHTDPYAVFREIRAQLSAQAERRGRDGGDRAA